MSSTQEEEYGDEIPFSVEEAIDPSDVGDLAEVKGDQAIDAVRDVVMIVVKASIDTQREYKDASEWAVKRLHIESKIGPMGTDGEGRYAEKRFFTDLVVAFPMTTVDGRRVADLSALERIHQTAVDAGKKKDKKGQDKPFPRDWWLKQSQFDFKEFALATGLAQMVENEQGQKSWRMTGPINDEMLAILASGDVQFIANITKSFDAFRQADRNELKRFRPVAQGEAE